VKPPGQRDDTNQDGRSHAPGSGPPRRESGGGSLPQEALTAMVGQRLDEMAAKQGADLAAAAAAADAPGQDLVEPTLRRLWAEQDAARPPANRAGLATAAATPAGLATAALAPAARHPGPDQRRSTSQRSLRRALLGLAAALLLAVVWWSWQEPARRVPPIVLGGGGLQLVQSVGSFDASGTLEWTHPQAGSLLFDVVVLDSSVPAGDERALVAHGDGLDVPHWTDPLGSAHWPDEVTVRITARDASGSPVEVLELPLVRAPDR